MRAAGGSGRGVVDYVYMQLCFPARLVLLLSLAASLLRAQSPATTNPTQVLATLTVKEGVARDQIMQVMPTEVRDTVQMYLDGKIQQWFARGDGRGVVFILSAKTAAEAKAMTDALPLVKAGFASFEFMPLGPLTPLRLLLAPAARP